MAERNGAVVENPHAANEQLFRDAVNAARVGQKSLARDLLSKLRGSNPHDERIWLWSAAVSESTGDSIRFLNEVLRLNPNNPQARSALALQQQKAALTPIPPQIPQESPQPSPELPPNSSCPLCGGENCVRLHRCTQCGSVLSLDLLKAMLSNGNAHEAAIARAIQALLDKQSRYPTGAVAANLGIAYLNLGRSTEGLQALRQARDLGHSDPALERVLDSLGRRRLVLAVDDSMTVRRVVTTTLEKQGYRVVTAVDGMEALAILNREVPHLILLDITMPRMDGYQVCRTVKQNPYTRDIPVLMLSGNDGFFDKMKGKLAGATGYITKPFESDKLIATVQRYIKPEQES